MRACRYRRLTTFGDQLANDRRRGYARVGRRARCQGGTLQLAARAEPVRRRGCANLAVPDRVATAPAGTENLAPCAGTQSTPGRSAAGWSWPT